MQGLTATSRDEQLALLEILLNTDADTGLMHEGFHKDDPSLFTRPWFAWANSLFAEFVMGIPADP
jgi:meiotically up-regulated gene 157 (Mug157) protein